MTVAQFLYSRGRYDGARQRPLLENRGGKDPGKYRKERLVVIDECSMVTLDDLHAVLEALDLAHVQRLMLVGDPNQLPPIGIGRPFADLVLMLEQAAQSPDDVLKERAGALARLTIELRTAKGAPSDALRLASWFTREPQPVDADGVLSALESTHRLNDLETCFWTTGEELEPKSASRWSDTSGYRGLMTLRASTAHSVSTRRGMSSSKSRTAWRTCRFFPGTPSSARSA